ncbi:hypothetical protein GQF56_15450 [Rhodobacter sphaeroides]|jgi:hypothetical protein|uniref:DUF1376 domain-containing protein n=2 Tax=Cereibacter TaxID=1653176 RepID=Q3IVP1_CERS4|nr:MULTISPECIES: hypothetical protein [Cereibacter]ABA81393.1 hypothetical protein RSP_3776 [Cereibacter sphaeroides 2.4.1]AMJ49681.1 hypothetical protein APX01_19245 [Cereibacter sphaeroides]ANS36396.1 hypothetical protein A3858_19250 [Cereibacter sphaeroides]ATN65453.1 hypothetical protein A3857_19275 [Cereibacter sphaeroides]AXC63678.1 hypothetical protein DQL45_20115 [Cereibacter sphaeroides 2.4.1]
MTAHPRSVPAGSAPRLIEAGHLPDYPLDPNQRLTTHFFMAWHHDRWLNSRFRLSAPPDVRGLAFDLFCLSQKQTPVGTLPDDDVQLAALLMLDLKAWQSYRSRDWSPLYKWVPCQCDGEVRLMHSVVVEIILESLSLREKRRVEGETGRRRKRLARLPDQILDAGGTRKMAADPGLLERIDSWLVQFCPGNRTRDMVRRALEADALAQADAVQGIGA